jgi:phosphotriesterase-related protein
MTAPPAGAITTVLGPVAPAETGVALMHEHVLVDLKATFAPVDDPELARYRDAPVSEELLDLLRVWPFSLTLDNVRLDDEALAVEELTAFAAAGGSLVVDCTPEGIGRDAAALQRVARATGLHIVQGTGFHVELAHPPFVRELADDALAEHFVRELTEGIGETGVRAGVIGEIGTSGVDPGSRRKRGDMTPAEEKVLRAAGAASVQTGAAVTVHLDPRGTGAYRAIEVLAAEGVAPERMIMGHLDANFDLDYHLRVAATGVYVEYDHFGREYYAGHMGRPYTRDARRIEGLCALVARGFAGQLLLSQDVCAKIDLHRHGGNGYDHILRRIVPELRARGVDDAAIGAMLVDNPRRALAF